MRRHSPETVKSVAANADFLPGRCYCEDDWRKGLPPLDELRRVLPPATERAPAPPRTFKNRSPSCTTKRQGRFLPNVAWTQPSNPKCNREKPLGPTRTLPTTQQALDIIILQRSGLGWDLQECRIETVNEHTAGTQLLVELLQRPGGWRVVFPSDGDESLAVTGPLPHFGVGGGRIMMCRGSCKGAQ